MRGAARSIWCSTIDNALQSNHRVANKQRAVELFAVIASEAKQSRSPEKELDCFVASLLPMTTSLHARQHFELVERRRRGQRPFQRGGAGAPRIVRSLLFFDEGQR